MQPYIGHVQVSQVPLRDCPVGDGEINHNFILKKINEVYKDYIGLEYISMNYMSMLIYTHFHFFLFILVNHN